MSEQGESRWPIYVSIVGMLAGLVSAFGTTNAGRSRHSLEERRENGILSPHICKPRRVTKAVKDLVRLYRPTHKPMSSNPIMVIQVADSQHSIILSTPQFRQTAAKSNSTQHRIMSSSYVRRMSRKKNTVGGRPPPFLEKRFQFNLPPAEFKKQSLREYRSIDKARTSRLSKSTYSEMKWSALI